MLSFLYLGLFVILASCWIYTDSSLPLLITEGQFAVHISSFIFFMLMPIPFVFFMRSIVIRSKRILEILNLALFLNVIVQTSLYLGDIFTFLQMLPATHILLFVSIITIVSTVFLEKTRFHNKSMDGISIALVTLATFSIVAIFCFYLYPPAVLYYVLFCLGLLAFICIVTWAAISHAVSIMRKDADVAAYKKLAYTDRMTNLANRTAFDLKINTINANIHSYNSLAVAVFDLNMLKLINDTYGHSAGDRNIIRAAAFIASAFVSIGTCYRIGEDEFAVIFENLREPEITAAFEIFPKEIADDKIKNASKNTLAIDISYGYAFEKITEFNKSAADIFNSADANMYAMKKICKSNANMNK